MPGVYLELAGKDGRHGKVLKLAGERFVIGRGKECAVQLLSDVASRKHASLALAGNTWFVEDLESRNGTFLNGERVSKAPLKPLDLLAFGPSGTRARVVSLDPAPPMSELGDDEDPPLVQALPDRPRRTPAPKERPASSAARPSVILWALPVLGAAFGVATGWALWERFLPGIPFTEAGMPATLILELGTAAVPGLGGGAAAIVFGVLVTLWWGLVGFAFMHPVRRWLLLFLLAGGHLAIVFGFILGAISLPRFHMDVSSSSDEARLRIENGAEVGAVDVRIGFDEEAMTFAGAEAIRPGLKLKATEPEPGLVLVRMESEDGFPAERPLAKLRFGIDGAGALAVRKIEARHRESGSDYPLTLASGRTVPLRRQLWAIGLAGIALLAVGLALNGPRRRRR
jgi:hypothetical protein